MNDRIKELAAEARLTLSVDQQVAFQRAAELIVKECLSQVKEVVIPITADSIEDKIKEHFGVSK
jgi:uncharacterized membrane protein YheB (UPF0754 family)